MEDLGRLSPPDSEEQKKKKETKNNERRNIEDHQFVPILHQDEIIPQDIEIIVGKDEN